MWLLKNSRDFSAQITLPFVLLIGGIITEIAIAGSFVSYFLSSSSFGERLSQRAYTAAQVGISDAFVRITKNKEFTSADCGSPLSYEINLDSDSISVDVCRTSQISAGKYSYTVSSVATSLNRKKRLVGVLVVDTTTGKVSMESLLEQAVE